MNQETKKVLRFVCGAAFALLTLFTLYSLITYLFTWNNDQSLLFQDNMMDNVVKAKNGGGKLGFVWSNFLVSKLFGLASVKAAKACSRWNSCPSLPRNVPRLRRGPIGRTCCAPATPNTKAANVAGMFLPSSSL